jgi:hypothetical protein
MSRNDRAVDRLRAKMQLQVIEEPDEERMKLQV